MKITFCDLRDDCVSALEAQFRGVEDVVVRQCDLTKIKADAWGTAGNSFGDMGGGVDRAIDLYFGGAAQGMVQRAIQNEFFGELPVGSAVFVQPDPKKPALIYAPTMRVPGRLGPSINAYLAARTLFAMALKHRLASLACPLFGTGVGGLMPQDAADQMFQAYRLIVRGEWQQVRHLLQAPYVMR
jgi:O-acetyl-ADP-ribose deacetylase (regulator of RNase III)